MTSLINKSELQEGHNRRQVIEIPLIKAFGFWRLAKCPE
jgi:hypothetical protein